MTAIQSAVFYAGRRTSQPTYPGWTRLYNPIMDSASALSLSDRTGNSETLQRRLALFPRSTQIQDDRLIIGDCDVHALAERFGTPLYLYDRAELDHAAATYRQALRACWPARWQITYAGKAYLNPTLADWAAHQGFWVDCSSAAEIEIALHAESKRPRILVHGVNKSPDDLDAALRAAAVIVVDNLSELRRIAHRTPGRIPPDLWLRFQPGRSVPTHHAATQTGQRGSKFGMDEEQLFEAAVFCREHHLPLRGIHFHLGSQFWDASPFREAIYRAVSLARRIGLGDDWHFSVGGGWGVCYHEDELPEPDLESDYLRPITSWTQEACRQQGVALPCLHLEPGRSLVARAGVAIYRVGTVKRSGNRLWLLVDGGLADNPRPALYGVRYSCLTVTRPLAEPTENVAIAGPYCESGDVLIETIPLRRVEEGEYIALPVSGAYQLSMASNYNGALRPAVLLLEKGAVQVMERRETPADLIRRQGANQGGLLPLG